MTNKYYYQCRMKKKISNDSYKIYVAWIPEKYAKEGKWIKIKQEDGTWEDHWQVVIVGGKKEAKYVEDKERDYLKQRRVSDWVRES